MIFLKCLMFVLLFGASTFLGITVSKKYVNRVDELRELKAFLNLLKTKIKFTYEPLGEIFYEISSSFSKNVSNLLLKASNNMKTNNAGKSWKLAVENTNMNLLKEDKEALITLSKLLGKTNLEGQVSQIEQTENLLDIQIEKAEIKRQKNEKMYKSMGMIVGAGLVIILI